MTLDEIKKIFAEKSIEEYDELILSFENDERKSIRQFLDSCRRKSDLWKKEQIRLEKMLEFEKKYDCCEYIENVKNIQKYAHKLDTACMSVPGAHSA